MEMKIKANIKRNKYAIVMAGYIRFSKTSAQPCFYLIFKKLLKFSPSPIKRRGLPAGRQVGMSSNTRSIILAQAQNVEAIVCLKSYFAFP
jgi:hypothetical protein